ncbi:MAG: hypothetical protein CMJ49_10635 [Planctomycetaceae bacterium]|nr:hypothetical protein [Planctomycetaceae bacterium]
MAKSTEIPVFDGATLSRKLKLKPGAVAHAPIGKPEESENGKQVARNYKHAAGKSNTYSPAVVDMIYHMARSGHLGDAEIREFVAAKLDAERALDPKLMPATFDQLVFLSANLTRLVIDPYRERCESSLQLGEHRPRPIDLAWPVVIGGIDFDRLPDHVRDAALGAADQANLAIFVRPDTPRGPDGKAPRIVEIDVTKSLPELNRPAAVALTAPIASQLTAENIRPAIEALRAKTDAQIPLGITAPAINAAQVVDATIDLDVDLYVADAQWTDDAQPAAIVPELGAAPALHVLADTIERVRHHCKEESVQVIYRGGIRGGADAGKALCIGASAATIGLSALLGMGFKITSVSDEAKLLAGLAKPLDPADAIHHLTNFAKSMNMEITMLARACGKSNVKNMEPEDLRALTVAVSAATGIPVTGKDFNFRRHA